MKESTVAKRVLLAASEIGWRLFRNNVGKLRLADGRFITVGLCRGSSDYIGWRPVVITQDMVGTTIAQFVGVETKTPGKGPSPAQVNWMEQVSAAGGLAFVADHAADVANAEDESW